MATKDSPDLKQKLSGLFGLYKAEWMRGHLFDVYTEPEYFSELETNRPCALIGGRGTGKTTVLRGLSYEGRYLICEGASSSLKDWPYYGIYYRVDTNRVSAFGGSGLSDSDWARYFAHYFNLIICFELLQFVRWFEVHSGTPIVVPERLIGKFAASLNIQADDSLAKLLDSVELSLTKFEASINNIYDDPPKGLSMQGAPIDALCEALTENEFFKGKQFFLIIDEYENFYDYQQRVVNTVIKHVKPSYTFKIGVRELGWRVRATLNENEHLHHPADYSRIDIGQEFSTDRFKKFASRVCNSRLRSILGDEEIPVSSVESMLPALAEEDEAILLGVETRIHKIRTQLEGQCPPADLVFFDALSPLQKYLIGYWSESQGDPLDRLLADMQTNPERWRDRYNNYAYASLFSIRSGKRGIRKYYSGWDVFCLVANGNIRFLMELVHQSLLAHFDANGRVGHEITPDCQTRAAQVVGQKYLAELEGASVDGAKLVKLLLGLGRIFEVLAADPAGHTPEVNQFYLADDSSIDKLDDSAWSDDESISPERLLRSAIMHLALIRFPGTKKLSEKDTAEFDYMVHPIFAPMFCFSHRRKRKLKLTGRQLVGLITSHKEYISEILSQNNRSDQEELPDQLALFSGYFHREN